MRFLRPTLPKILVAKLLGLGLLILDFATGARLFGSLSMAAMLLLVCIAYVVSCLAVHAHEQRKK